MHYRVPLIPSIVPLDYFNSAISDAYVRSYFDKPKRLHPNGDFDSVAICSHKNNGLFRVSVRTIGSLLQYLPLG